MQQPYTQEKGGCPWIPEVSPEKFLLKSRFTFKKFKGKFRTSDLGSEDAEKPTWTHPIISGRKLFLRDGDTISCYDMAAR